MSNVCVCVCPYLCKTLICSYSIDLDILAFLDEPHFVSVGLMVVHVECLQNKQYFTFQTLEMYIIRHKNKTQ